MKAQHFKDLLIWQKAHELVLLVYQMTDSFPKSEVFGLTSQIRRSSVSVPANIAEGFRRKGIADKLRFYNIAQSSLDETSYYFILIQDLKYANTTELQQKTEELAKMLNAFMTKMNS